MRKQDNVANAGAIREKHDQPVYADPFASRGRQAIFERADVIRVVVHGLGVTRFLRTGLFLEACLLILRIVQFGKAIGDFAARNIELEPVRYSRIRVVAPGKGGDFSGIINDESRLKQQMSVVSSNNVSCSPPIPSSGL